jgi:hypothetical protein
LIGGTVYNYVEKQQIEADIADLKSKMYRLEIMEEFNVTDSYLSKRKAIVAKSVCAILEPKNKAVSPDDIKKNLIHYFSSRGWHIHENRNSPLEHIQVENQEYIITLDRISPDYDTWRMVIGHNTFFEKYNL